jgi:hypothetical protein
MQFLVESEVEIPEGTREREVGQRSRVAASADDRTVIIPLAPLPNDPEPVAR